MLLRNLERTAHRLGFPPLSPLSRAGTVVDPVAMAEAIANSTPVIVPRSTLPEPFVHDNDRTVEDMADPVDPTVVPTTGQPPGPPEPSPRRGAVTPVPIAGLLPAAGALLNVEIVRLMCDAQDRTPEDSRVGQQAYVHVSSLVNLCARHYVLARRRGDSVVRAFTGGHKVTFAIGRAVQEHVRQSVIRALNRQHIYGGWTCACGEASMEGLYVGGLSCAHCRTPIERYEELVLTNEEYGIVGSPDLTFRSEDGLIPIEIKSISLPRWELLDGPLANDLLQVLLYRWLFQQTPGIPVRREVIIFYVAKNFRWGSPYKEYHVDAESQTCQSMLNRALEIAMTVKEAGTEGPLPERVCDSDGCQRARDCPLSVSCFNLSD